jgi:hypothetical protein
MAKAFVYPIGVNAIDSHQGSPESVLTVVRWSNRDPFHYDTDSLAVLDPMIITNDCISLSVNNSKKGPNSQLSAVLMGGDVNYQAAVAPGDLIIANMLNWPEDAQRVAQKARDGKPINHWNDGFKGVFKIQTVRERLVVLGDGKKYLVYTIHALGFTELNIKHYYNQAISDAFGKAGVDISQTAIGDVFKNLLKSNTNIQIIIETLFLALIGKDSGKKDLKVPDYGQTHFKLPPSFGKFFGRKMTYVSDLFNYYLGVWDNPNQNTTNPWSGFNTMFGLKDKPNFYYTKNQLQGNKLVTYENWNMNTVWSIIFSYLNDTVNEMYTTYRTDPNGYIFPSVVIRQKPFSNEFFDFKNSARTEMPLTYYMELPRWKISPDLITEHDLGRDEAARINFVQVFTRALSDNNEQNVATQIKIKNFVYDKNDILRNGIKPYVATANFDFPNAGQKALRASMWAEVVADWLIGGHLKQNGTLACMGIVEPLSVGDNLEYNNIVYHIEDIAYKMQIDGEGKKMFNTLLTLSYGMSTKTDAFRPVYPNMDFSNSYYNSVDDYKNEKILPGFSDSQDISGRTNGEKKTEKQDQSFTLNPNFKTTTIEDFAKYEEPKPKVT